MIDACHIRNYSIFLRRLPDGRHYLFSYFEYLGDDFDTDMARMAADPVTQKWWDLCKPYTAAPHRAAGEWWAQMDASLPSRLNAAADFPQYVKCLKKGTCLDEDINPACDWKFCTRPAGTLAMISAAAADSPNRRPGRPPGQNTDPAPKRITQHPVAEWFRDAKFGIYFHWGPYSVPAYDNEWYSRNMYIKGTAVYKYHVAKYGGPEKFGYKDFIPLFTAEKFDADEWADLFQQAATGLPAP